MTFTDDFLFFLFPRSVVALHVQDVFGVRLIHFAEGGFVVEVATASFDGEGSFGGDDEVEEPRLAA